MMSRLCFQVGSPSTEAYDIKEVDSLPKQAQFEKIKTDTSLYLNHIQALDRLYVDIKTANVFPSLISQQNKFVSLVSFNFKQSKLFSPMLDSQEIYREIDSWNISFRTKKLVNHFLLDHPELMEIIPKADLIIRNYFSDYSLLLEVQTDPEDDSLLLILFIQTSLSAKEAYDALDQIDNLWWTEISEEIGDLMCLHVEFQ